MKRFLIALAALLLCSFTLDAQSQPPREENSLRIMSYNVRNCKGMDNKTDIDRVAGVILAAAPDVVAIQELDSMTIRNRKDMLGELARRTLMHATFASPVRIAGGRYGIGILSKEKPLQVKRIPLPGKEEKRMLLMVEFERYVMLCTHFSLTEKDRLTSTGIILDAVADVDKPVFLAGDMNDTNDSEMQRRLTGKFRVLNNPEQPTFGTGDNTRCIDFIYGLEGATPYSVLARKVIPDEIASDHRPVWVDVRLAADEEDIFRTRPYLQNPVGGGITVTWLTGVPVHSWVEYSSDRVNWTKAQTFTNGQVVAGNKIHKIRLEGLTPGVRYHYRVASREITLYGAYNKEFGHTAVSDEFSFRLPAPGENDFTALVFNDLHKNKPLVDTLMTAVKGVDYDLVFLNGDIVDDPKNEDAAVDFLSYLTEKIDAANHPIILLRGNHEIRNAYSVELGDLLDYVGGKTYGSFDWGDTRFVMLDCGEDKPDDTPVYYDLNDFTQLRVDQAAFLGGELACEDFLEAGKRVLIHHIPVYGVREGGFNPSGELWCPLLAGAPFNVAINGHTHRRTVHAKGSVGNDFPVAVGGGSNVETGTVMILERKGDELTLRMLATSGETLHDLAL